MSGFIRQLSMAGAFNTSGSWVILNPIEQSIKAKIERIGKPLKDWDIKIYRGILTGCNEAFIIDAVKRDEILANCITQEERRRTDELIRPILRGRDIKRYGYEFANLYIIASHNGVPDKKIPRINIDDYPAVKRHLDSFWPQISIRSDMGDTPYNLRSCAYWEDFSKPKIIYPETTQGAYFAFDCEHIFIDKTCFMIISNNAKYLLAILSSPLYELAYKRIFSSIELSVNGYQYNKHALVKLPVLAAHPSIMSSHIFDCLSSPNSIKTANRKIYELYSLSEDEICYVEKFVTRE